MSIHEQMGWVRYREIQEEIRARDRERMLRPDRKGSPAMPSAGGVSVRHRIGWGIMRVGARIAASERP